MGQPPAECLLVGAEAAALLVPVGFRLSRHLLELKTARGGPLDALVPDVQALLGRRAGGGLLALLLPRRPPIFSIPLS